MAAEYSSSITSRSPSGGSHLTGSSDSSLLSPPYFGQGYHLAKQGEVDHLLTNFRWPDGVTPFSQRSSHDQGTLLNTITTLFNIALQDPDKKEAKLTQEHLDSIPHAAIVYLTPIFDALRWTFKTSISNSRTIEFGGTPVHTLEEALFKWRWNDPHLFPQLFPRPSLPAYTPQPNPTGADEWNDAKRGVDVDFSFVIQHKENGYSSSTEYSVPIHKIVLRKRSAYFADLIEQLRTTEPSAKSAPWDGSHNVFHFKDLLQFVYQGVPSQTLIDRFEAIPDFERTSTEATSSEQKEINQKREQRRAGTSEIVAMYRLAYLTQTDQLTNFCRIHLSRLLDSDILFTVAQTALECNDEYLLQQCQWFIASKKDCHNDLEHLSIDPMETYLQYFDITERIGAKSPPETAYRKHFPVDSIQEQLCKNLDDFICESNCEKDFLKLLEYTINRGNSHGTRDSLYRRLKEFCRNKGRDPDYHEYLLTQRENFPIVYKTYQELLCEGRSKAAPSLSAESFESPFASSSSYDHLVTRWPDFTKREDAQDFLNQLGVPEVEQKSGGKILSQLFMEGQAAIRQNPNATQVPLNKRFLKKVPPSKLERLMPYLEQLGLQIELARSDSRQITVNGIAEPALATASLRWNRFNSIFNRPMIASEPLIPFMDGLAAWNTASQGILTDYTFSIQTEGEGRVDIPVNRTRLLHRSDAFSDIFYQNPKSKGSIVTETNDPELFKDLLYFIYTNTPSERMQAQQDDFRYLLRLFDLAHKTRTPSVVQFCRAHLNALVDAASMLEIAEVAEQVQDHLLLETCRREVGNDPKYYRHYGWIQNLPMKRLLNLVAVTEQTGMTSSRFTKAFERHPVESLQELLIQEIERVTKAKDFMMLVNFTIKIGEESGSRDALYRRLKQACRDTGRSPHLNMLLKADQEAWDAWSDLMTKGRKPQEIY